MNELTQHWEQTGLLERISDNKKDDLARVLENQRVFNEGSVRVYSKFLRISIPLVYRLFVGGVIKQITKNGSKQLQTNIKITPYEEQSDMTFSTIKENKEAQETIVIVEALKNLIKDNFSCLSYNDNGIVIIYE